MGHNSGYFLLPWMGDIGNRTNVSLNTVKLEYTNEHWANRSAVLWREHACKTGRCLVTALRATCLDLAQPIFGSILGLCLLFGSSVYHIPSARGAGVILSLLVSSK